MLSVQQGERNVHTWALFLGFLLYLVSRNSGPRAFSGIALVDGELHNVQIRSYAVAQCSHVYGVTPAYSIVPDVLRYAWQSHR